jgi:hypothetical protein
MAQRPTKQNIADALTTLYVAADGMESRSAQREIEEHLDALKLYFDVAAEMDS